MNIINQMDAILNSVWTNIVFFVVLIVFLIGTFLIYKKGEKIYYYYAKGFLFILLSFLVSIAKEPLIPGSLLDLVGLVVLIIFLVIGVYNIFYLAEKKSK
ncbi:MAG: hypothetical protein ABH952_05480 [Candidatus Omnitrophota bacterium]